MSAGLKPEASFARCWSATGRRPVAGEELTGAAEYDRRQAPTAVGAGIGQPALVLGQPPAELAQQLLAGHLLAGARPGALSLLRAWVRRRLRLWVREVGAERERAARILAARSDESWAINKTRDL